MNTLILSVIILSILLIEGKRGYTFYKTLMFIFLSIVIGIFSPRLFFCFANLALFNNSCLEYMQFELKIASFAIFALLFMSRRYILLSLGISPSITRNLKKNSNLFLESIKFKIKTLLKRKSFD